MATDPQVLGASGDRLPAPRSVVAAVDGSERNRSAVHWAAGEAARLGCDLVLVTALADHLIPEPHFSVRSPDDQARDMLASVRREVQHEIAAQAVHARIEVGSALEVVLEAAQDARMIVVGKRGLGTFGRIIVGSTSVAVAGRSDVPVTVVPDPWKQADHRLQPVVLGLDPDQADSRLLHLAFRRAEELQVPLVVMHGWELPAVYSWDAASVAGFTTDIEREARHRNDEVLAPWREQFHDVEVRAMHRHVHPATAVLDAAEHAQLVVLGRHRRRRVGGFAFGSVARNVLHYSDCPVTVVPTGG